MAKLVGKTAVIEYQVGFTEEELHVLLTLVANVSEFEYEKLYKDSSTVKELGLKYKPKMLEKLYDDFRKILRS
jgi:hypothetical protein